MTRITDNQLQAVVDRINQVLKQPMHPYMPVTEGVNEYAGQVGNYHLESANNGVKLVQMVAIDGGTRDVFSCGYTTKRELYELMHAFLRGYDACSDTCEQALGAKEDEEGK